MKERIGFIGLGSMGAGMAANLLEKGWPLTVWAHRSRDAVDRLVAAGATEAESPRKLAEACDIVILCVTGSREVEARRSRAAGGRADGQPPQAAAHHRLLDLQSVLDHRASSRTRRARRDADRRAAGAHAEGSGRRQARRHGRRSAGCRRAGAAGARSLRRAHRAHRADRQRPHHEAAQQFRLDGLFRHLFGGADARRESRADAAGLQQRHLAAAAWIAASTRPSSTSC